jgi:hypothetical protein
MIKLFIWNKFLLLFIFFYYNNFFFKFFLINYTYGLVLKLKFFLRNQKFIIKNDKN